MPRGNEKIYVSINEINEINEINDINEINEINEINKMREQRIKDREEAGYTTIVPNNTINNINRNLN